MWLTPEDEQALRQAAEILADQADDMVTAWRARLGDLHSCGPTPATPTARPTPSTAPATHPRFDRFIIDACTRPLDQDWLNYQQEMGLRHTRAKKNLTDHADSLDHIPLRYLLAFTAVVIATSRDYLAAKGASPEQVDRMHANFRYVWSLARNHSRLPLPTWTCIRDRGDRLPG
jgi:hypothetical protein